MRSVALIATLVAAASALAITPQAYPAAGPATGAFGIPLEGSAYSTWDTVSQGSGNAYTYKITKGDVGKNFYFRTTLYACDTAGSMSFQTAVSGNDGTGHLGSGDFNNKASAVGFSPTDANNDGTVTMYTSSANATQLIVKAADSVAKAPDQTWTFTVSLVGSSSLKCQFYADLITYGTLLGSAAVGADGNPGKVQDAWIPCCDATTSSYQLAMTAQEHKYLEVAGTTDKGGFDSLKLTNPNSLFGVIVDTTAFPSGTHTGSVTARTCLTNSSCSIITDNYFVQFVTHAYAYSDDAKKDFHATFTLTTKAGVASASATIAFAVAALFALFH
jgi:hypothetical protein